jgi:L-amino acid N-acyltransferase YncA
MKLTARNLVLQDADLVFRWRNTPEVRNVSIDTSVVSPIEHYNWIKNWLKAENRGYFWIYSDSIKDVGYVRFDSLDDPAFFEISILIDEKMRGRGLGKLILQDSVNQFALKGKGDFLRAVVHASNTASVKLFLFSGFKQVNNSTQWVEFSLNLQEFR